MRYPIHSSADFEVERVERRRRLHDCIYSAFLRNWWLEQDQERKEMMLSHISFSFGLGDYFKFSFSLGRPRDPPPLEDESRKALTEFDKAMAKVTDPAY